MENAKICVCFYGFLRSFHQTHSSLKHNIISKYNTDVFICAPSTFYGDIKSDSINSCENPKVVDEQYLTYSCYGNLKKCQIIENNISIYKNKVKESGIPEKNFLQALTWRSYSMFDYIRKVLELKKSYEQENNIKYDITILVRPDLQIAKNLELDKLDLNKLHHSISHAAPVYGTDKKFGDHLLVSKSENIDKFISLYDNVENYYKQGITINNETLMGFHLLKNNIEWEKSDFVLHGVIR